MEVKSGHNTPVSIPLRVQGRCNLNLALANGQDGRGSVKITAGEAADNPRGALVQVTASPNDGYVFWKWVSGQNYDTEVSADNPYEFTIIEDTTLYAVFVPLHSLTVAVANRQGEWGTAAITKGSAEGNIAGTSVEVTASPNDGYVFVRWARDAANETEVSTANPYEFLINDYAILYAVFAPLHSLTVAVANGQSSRGSVEITQGSAAGNIAGTPVEVTATPASGCTFWKWASDPSYDTEVSTDNPYGFAITGDTTLYAVFVPVYSLTVGVVTGQEGRGMAILFEGSATGNIAGTPVKIKVLETNGWFIRWSTTPNGDSPAFVVDGVDLSFDNPCEFAINEDITLYAVFSATPPAGLQKTEHIYGVSVPFRYVPEGNNFQRDTTLGNVTSISRGYWMAETETTQELFEAIMRVNPSYHDGGPYPPITSLHDPSGYMLDPREAEPDEVQSQRPVEQVNWYHAIAFCNKLSLATGKELVYDVNSVNWNTLDYTQIPTSDDPVWNAATADITKNGYRLPTEMEWLWAAMGADIGNSNGDGYNKPFAGGNGSNNIYYYAWLGDYNNYDPTKTHQVGKKEPNELGLYDMTGNVAEWCWDRTGGNDDLSNTMGSLIDYEGGTLGTSRVFRGLDYSFRINSYSPTTPSTDTTASIGNHSGTVPFSNNNGRTGFRVVCTLAPPSSSSPH